jgi:hypothetical protein
MTFGVNIQVLYNSFTFTVVAIIHILPGRNDLIQAGQCALPGVRGASLKCRPAGLIPKGHAGIIVLTLNTTAS